MNKADDKPKQLHEMTRKEYEEKHGKARKNTTVTDGFHPHKSAVETALNQGKNIPEHVLADYPDLKKAAPKGVSEEKYKSCKEQVAAKQGGSETKPYNVYAVCASALKKATECMRKGCKLEKDLPISDEQQLD